MTQTAMKLSRYVLFSPRSFRDSDGVSYRYGYASRTATIFRLRTGDAETLELGQTDRLPAGLLRQLIDIESIVDGGEDELAEMTRRMRADSHGSRLRRFVILPTSYCNMACAYCGQEHFKDSFADRRVQQKIDRVTAAIADPGTSALHITWFGGEPLLGLRVMTEISSAVVPAVRAANKPFSSDVVTNGSLLSHRVLLTLYDTCQVRWLEVTIDGPAEVHNRRRKMRNGAGTFEHIVTLLAEVIERDLYPGMHFGIRTNVDNENEDTIPDLITELAARGLASPRVILKPAPVHSWGNDVSERMLRRQEYARRELDWIRLALSLGMTMPAGLPVRPRRTTCLATTRRSEVIDSTGRMYTCTEHPLVPAEAGRRQVSTLDLLPSTALRPVGDLDTWYDEVENKEWQCARCPFLPVCGGGCPKLWKEGELPCPSFKFTWADRLDQQARAQGLVMDA